MTRKVEHNWTTVRAHFELEGVHNFPNVDAMLEQQDDGSAGEGVKVSILDVSFLKYPHRHIFKFDVWVDVNHDDRDIEFIQLGRLLKYSMLHAFPVTTPYGCSNFENRSCETLGQIVADMLLKLYPAYYGNIMVEVSEDGENSAVCKFTVTEEENVD